MQRSRTVDTLLGKTSKFVMCDASLLDGVCGIVGFKNHTYMNALTVISYFESVQCRPGYCDTIYARDCHMISHAFLLIHVATHSVSCRLVRATLSYVRFSAVVYKSFHDIGLENCNLISEIASYSVQCVHKSRGFCVRVTNRRQKWERERHFLILTLHSKFVRLITHCNENNAVSHIKDASVKNHNCSWWYHEMTWNDLCLQLFAPSRLWVFPQRHCSR
jgi:hypothetical protein